LVARSRRMAGEESKCSNSVDASIPTIYAGDDRHSHRN
jgi:hypothetical protein